MSEQGPVIVHEASGATRPGPGVGEMTPHRNRPSLASAPGVRHPVIVARAHRVSQRLIMACCALSLMGCGGSTSSVSPSQSTECPGGSGCATSSTVGIPSVGQLLAAAFRFEVASLADVPDAEPVEIIGYLFDPNAVDGKLRDLTPAARTAIESALAPTRVAWQMKTGPELTAMMQEPGFTGGHFGASAPLAVEDHFEVQISFVCGLTCGRFRTVVVSEENGMWTATGTTGSVGVF
jgi:hypothetical protein